MSGEHSRSLSPFHRDPSPPSPEPPDDLVLTLDDETEDLLDSQAELVLVGRVLESKSYRQQAVTDALVFAWNLIREIQITPMAHHQFIFQFNHLLDVQNVLDGGPWAVTANLLILEPWNTTDRWDFTHVDFWVHFKGIPPELLHLELGFQLRKKLGSPKSVMLIQGSRASSPQAFLRCRISMDIRKPLKDTL
ncbi:uncharacterized protein LOC122652732 [Telopea speciosissima]|uniref:uncharacterized protein LOC122652732 n=1 Tax=Telopea speciosissima TaxID=54955 RepID=UPI001CC45CE2|nr:uncharacterized protein LOC122652732 [Telopea speciosissima]